MQLGSDKAKDTRHAAKEPAQASEGLIPSLELGKRSEKPLSPPAPVSSRDAELPPVPRVSSGFQRGPSRSFSAEEVLAAGMGFQGMAEFRLGGEDVFGELQYRETGESDWETVDYYEVMDAGTVENYNALCAFIAESSSCPPGGVDGLDLPPTILPPPVPAVGMPQPIDHTQGPWKLEPGGRWPDDPMHIRTVEETPCVIAEIPVTRSKWFLPLRPEEIPGNGRIMAMAPDLYKVAYELIYGGGTVESQQRAIDLARIALGLEHRDYRTPSAWPVNNPFVRKTEL